MWKTMLKLWCRKKICMDNSVDKSYTLLTVLTREKLFLFFHRLLTTYPQKDVDNQSTCSVRIRAFKFSNEFFYKHIFYKK